MPYFLDTNILIYAYAAGDPRAARAQHLLRDGGAISVQCLNEFGSVALRKLRMPWPELHEALDLIANLCAPIVVLDRDLHRAGLRIAETRQVSLYDGMILAAALAAGCDVAYSEDMHHGLVVDGRLTVTNPFLSA
jgi:predicted nucleic acid-binding protein